MEPVVIPPAQPPKRRLFPVIGIGIGAVVLLSAIAGVMVSQRSEAPLPEPTPAPVVAQPTLIPVFLSLDRAQQNAVIINGELLVSGMTLPNTTVVMYSPIDSAATESDSHGYFEETLRVGTQDTQVTVTAFGQNGQEHSVTIDVMEAPELSFVGAPQVLGKNTDSPGNVKKENNTNQQDAARANTNRPTKPPAPTPRQVKTEEFLGVRRPTYQSPKIGLEKMKEYLATDASGSAGLARTVAIRAARLTEATSSAMLEHRRAVAGVITAVGNGMVTVAHLIDRSRETVLYYNADTVVSMKGAVDATPASLAVAMRVAAVGQRAPEGLLAVRIHVIPGNATGALQRQPVATGSGLIIPASPSAALMPTDVLVPTVILPSPTPILEP